LFFSLNKKKVAQNETFYFFKSIY